MIFKRIMCILAMSSLLIGCSNASSGSSSSGSNGFFGALFSNSSNSIDKQIGKESDYKEVYSSSHVTVKENDYFYNISWWTTASMIDADVGSLYIHKSSGVEFKSANRVVDNKATYGCVFLKGDQELFVDYMSDIDNYKMYGDVIADYSKDDYERIYLYYESNSKEQYMYLIDYEEIHGAYAIICEGIENKDELNDINDLIIVKAN